MKQPELGETITNLRRQKNLTQEDLAEICEVSARTIQRIESSEAEPRASTLNSLSEALEYDFNGIDEASNEAAWLAALHLSSVFCLLIIPLLIWTAKRKTSRKIDRQGRDVLNFQITITLLLFSAAIFFAILFVVLMNMGLRGPEQALLWFSVAAVGLLPTVVLGLFAAYQGILNCIRTLGDRPYRYRLSIPFIQ